MGYPPGSTFLERGAPPYESPEIAEWVDVGIFWTVLSLAVFALTPPIFSSSLAAPAATRTRHVLSVAAQISGSPSAAISGFEFHPPERQTASAAIVVSLRRFLHIDSSVLPAVITYDVLRVGSTA